MSRHADRSASTLLRQINVTERPFEGWPVYEVTPRTEDVTGHVLYVHGGGYVSRLQPTHQDLIARLAALTGRAFTVPDFPVAPGHTHRDVFPTLRRLYDHVAGRSGTKRFAMMGDSAGGTMAMALVQSLPEGHPRPADLILMSPWLDATMTNPDIPALEPYDPMSSTEDLTRLARMWAGGDELSAPWLSPVNGPLANLGRVTVFAGANDILTPDARRLTRLADGAAGTRVTLHEYPGMTHAFMLLRPSAETDAVLAEIVKQLGDGNAAAGH
ncbi:alpha/beta hydrolase [Micromonospora sp. WMMD812]|uniref:alpha/beta hydrolase fold domain-containing protein n=1 Tax=Micromonospora sp. WMMD812 TaxID=3015152 RepID=UPI00248C4D5E|nr:alpha/beta hydrolase [Micromonospora sp. WMMD812]WBB69346.1 alpha/beta hydrolase [Micromonospora sp. WMMD812]